METFTVKAVYHKGILKPQKKLDLPEDAVVQLQVTPLPIGDQKSGSLFGAFPELASVRDEDHAWARREWEEGLKNQSRLIDKCK